jgi:serine/threonine-protein kinase
MLHLELSTDAEARQRFLREGYVANAVEHPGAVSVLDDDVADDGSVFLVMELLDGNTVEARAASRPDQKLEPGEVLAIIDQLLDILAAAHKKGIVHRDLKPENVFLTRTGQVKVLDFGLARLQGLAQGSGAKRMTATGNAMGSPAFMPPEQALGNWDAVDGRTDLWAVGASMFNLLTGRFVHEADTVNKLLLAAMTKPPRKIATVDPDVPPAVAAIVDRALAFEQKDRWPDAAAMRDAVRKARTTVQGEIETTEEEEPAEGISTLLKVGAEHRAPLVSSLGPTSSEPRLTVGKRGVLAGSVFLGMLGGALLYVATRDTARTPAAAIEGGVPTSPTSVAQAPPVPSAAATIDPGVLMGETPKPAVTVVPTVEGSVKATARPAPTTSASARGGRPRPTSGPRPSAGSTPDPLGKW